METKSATTDAVNHQNISDLFQKIKKNIIGENTCIQTPYHASIPLVYADWTASGRMYQPIEDRLIKEVYPLLANTHTETNSTGKATTRIYHEAQEIIKKHVGANEEDLLITDGSGMTGVVNKFQRILGIKLHERFQEFIEIPEEDRPIIFVTHMEHHSNHISWSETIGDVRIIPNNDLGLPCEQSLIQLLTDYQNRKHKFASITAASNVTGILTDYGRIASIMHDHGGLCFVDFACGAPYLKINMHPENPKEHLDAIFFSPHKFLGGPSTSGVLIFNKSLYKNVIPDHPGGGTVVFTSPFQRPKYIDKIEEREDGGTPGFIQTIRTALAIRLKETMTTEAIEQREHQQIEYVFARFETMPGVRLLEAHNGNRLSIFSFILENMPHNLVVRMLNDRFGIQVRGGCSCAGTYGHYLLEIDETKSCAIINTFLNGNALSKPGWVRMSLHPTTTNDEMKFLCDAVEQIALNKEEWSKDYHLHVETGAIAHKNELPEKEHELFRLF
jgi:selenocysteine lyase/cysteine desulfurase